MNDREIEFVEVRRGEMVPAAEWRRRHAWRKKLKRWIDEDLPEFALGTLIVIHIAML